jgi:hypothetical protein
MAKQKKRIYTASRTSLEITIRAKSGSRIGTLSIEPNALNALSWLRKSKQAPSIKRKTLLNLIEWMER